MLWALCRVLQVIPEWYLWSDGANYYAPCGSCYWEWLFCQWFYLVCNYVSVGGTYKMNINMNATIQNFNDDKTILVIHFTFQWF